MHKRSILTLLQNNKRGERIFTLTQTETPVQFRAVAFPSRRVFHESLLPV